jgi:hypothetical protein
MTVGIAVLANRPRDAAETGRGANAVVLVADKQITQWTGLKADVEVEKKLELLYGWHLVFAGTPSAAHRMGWLLRQRPRREYAKRELLAETAERIYQQVWQREFEKAVLVPNLLTKKLVVARPRSLQPLSPTLLAEYNRSRIRFEDNDTLADMILAGFDGGRAALVVIAGGSAEIDQLGSFRVIGEGESAALPRLHELGAQSSDPVHVALYNALAAKFASEHVASVGPGTDAWILRRNKRPHRVDQALISDLRRVTDRRSRAWDSYRKTPPPLPVPGWQRCLVAYAAAVLGGSDPTWEGIRVASPSMSAPPSSLPPNDMPRSASHRDPSRASAHRVVRAKLRQDPS